MFAISSPDECLLDLIVHAKPFWRLVHYESDVSDTAYGDYHSNVSLTPLFTILSRPNAALNALYRNMLTLTFGQSLATNVLQ